MEKESYNYIFIFRYENSHVIVGCDNYVIREALGALELINSTVLNKNGIVIENRVEIPRRFITLSSVKEHMRFSNNEYEEFLKNVGETKENEQVKYNIF